MKRIVVLSIAVLALAGCSSKAASSSGTTTTTGATATTQNTATLGAHVLAIINTASATVNTDKAESGDSGFPGVKAAFNNAAQQLQALTYPSADQSDAKALVAILEKLSVDVSQVIAAPATGEIQNLENDEGTELADSDALRHDLGLPASPGA